MCYLVGGDVALSEVDKHYVEKIGKYRHYVFFVIDGLGYNLVSSFPKNGMLSKIAPEKIYSIFPSTTTAVLTSLATLKWPAEHGLLEWWTYFENLGIAGTVLPYKERETEADMHNWQPYPELIIPTSGWPKESEYSRFTFLPKDLTDSPCTRIFYGEDKSIIKYESFADGIDKLINLMKNSKEKSYSYFYYPCVDTSLHTHGTTGAEVIDYLRTIDWGIKKFRESVSVDECRVVMSADHGQINVSESEVIVLEDGNQMLDMLEIPPTGGSRVIMFHVKDGMSSKFEKYFNEKFGESFILYTQDEFIKQGYLGVATPSQNAIDHLGDFVAIPTGPSAMFYHPASQELHIKKGFHGGPSIDEMEIPLYIL